MKSPEFYTNSERNCKCCQGLIDIDEPVYRCSICDEQICGGCAPSCENCEKTICLECSKELKDGGWVCVNCEDKYQEDEFVEKKNE